MLDVIQIAARSSAGGSGGIAGVTGTNAPGSMPGGKPGDYVALPPPPTPPTKFDIPIIWDDAGVATVVTALPHGLVAPVDITITGTSVAAFNDDFTVETVNNPTSFTLGVAGDGLPSFGGQWAPA